jgi:hypothetical protein
VPLNDGTFAVGLIARIAPRGKIVLGYFFGPSREAVPTLHDVQCLDAKSVVYVRRFGDLGLYRGEWPIIGADTNFNPRDWPIPTFGQNDLTGHGPLIVRYNEDLAEYDREWSTPEVVKNLPEDGLAGSKYIENKLSKILCDKND